MIILFLAKQGNKEKFSYNTTFFLLFNMVLHDDVLLQYVIYIFYQYDIFSKEEFEGKGYNDYAILHFLKQRCIIQWI